MRDAEEGHFRAHTYHLDVRFEAAFTQPWQIAEAVTKAIAEDCRVILEHFDLLFTGIDLSRVFQYIKKPVL